MMLLAFATYQNMEDIVRDAILYHPNKEVPDFGPARIIQEFSRENPAIAKTKALFEQDEFEIKAGDFSHDFTVVLVNPEDPDLLSPYSAILDIREIQKSQNETEDRVKYRGIQFRFDNRNVGIGCVFDQTFHKSFHFVETTSGIRNGLPFSYETSITTFALSFKYVLLKYYQASNKICLFNLPEWNRCRYQMDEESLNFFKPSLPDIFRGSLSRCISSEALRVKWHNKSVLFDFWER